MAEELYNDYYKALDGVCAEAFGYIMEHVNEEKQIYLTNYNLNDDNHKFLIELIFATAGIIYKPIAIKSWWGRIKWRLRYRKRKKAVRWDKQSKALDITEALNYLYPTLVKFLGKGGSYAEIYHTYYEVVND